MAGRRYRRSARFVNPAKLVFSCWLAVRSAVRYSNYWSKLQELPDTDLRNRPLCSCRKIRLRALALLLQISGARFSRRTAHIPNSSKEAT